MKYSPSSGLDEPFSTEKPRFDRNIGLFWGYPYSPESGIPFRPIVHSNVSLLKKMAIQSWCIVTTSYPPFDTLPVKQPFRRCRVEAPRKDSSLNLCLTRSVLSSLSFLLPPLCSPLIASWHPLLCCPRKRSPEESIRAISLLVDLFPHPPSLAASFSASFPFPAPPSSSHLGAPLSQDSERFCRRFQWPRLLTAPPLTQ